ncbi:MAG: ABC-F family ATP-binding cassette domain-containing protein [Actinomycetota bacterium]
MAASLVTRSLTVTRGPRLVLDAVDLTVTPGDRIGLVGPNGIGKSTLLAALAGDLDPDEGSVERRPATATVGLLPQEPERSATETVHEFLSRRTGVAAAQRNLDAATAAMADGHGGADDRYAVALDRWLSLGAADLDTRVGEVFAELALNPELLDQVTLTLSGGEAARCTLASLLLARFDVFLLDEPTNDLDLESLARLENWVMGLRAPMVVVSHDRRFLERTVTDVVEIDHHSHQVSRFAGGWEAFLRERELAAQHARERFEEYDTKRRGLLARAQREREWASQGQAKVRRSGENDKFIRNFRIDQTEQLAGKAARTERSIERLEEVEEPREAWELRLSIPDAPRSGDRVCGAAGATVRLGDFMLGPVDVDIRFGDRVALLGPNGAGKSTLLSLLLGRIEPSSGEAWLGSGVVLGEIDQARDGLDPAATLVDTFMAATGDDVPTTRTLLAKFGLGAEHVGREVETLSPGERTRAALALLQARGANLLVLDEPTNHLDIEAIEQLEQALDTFAGTVLLVTHDRAFLDATCVTRRLHVDRAAVMEER